MLQRGGVDEEQALDRQKPAFLSLLDHVVLGGDNAGRANLLGYIFDHQRITA
ncbi:hypothetical protein D3C85_1896410 [compost metagenome]